MFRAIIVHHQELGTVCAAVRCISVRFSLQSAIFQAWCYGGGRVLCVVARGSEVQVKRCISFGCVVELFTGRCVCLVVLTGPVNPTLCCPANGIRLGLRFLDGGTLTLKYKFNFNLFQRYWWVKSVYIFLGHSVYTASFWSICQSLKITRYETNFSWPYGKADCFPFCSFVLQVIVTLEEIPANFFLNGHPLAFHFANDWILFEKKILKKKKMCYLTCSVHREKSRRKSSKSVFRSKFLIAAEPTFIRN
jgi:hypothetical protein